MSRQRPLAGPRGPSGSTLISAPMGALDREDGIIGRWFGGQIVQQLCDGVSAARIAEAGSDFVERDEDEGALGEARMRDFETGQAEDEIAVEENVEVEGARAVAHAGGAVAAELALDEENGAQQFERRESGFKSDDGVEEAGLIGQGDGRANWSARVE